MKKIFSLVLVVAILIMAWPGLAQAQEDGGMAALIPAEAPFYVSIATRPGIEAEIEALVAKLSQTPAEGMLTAQALDPLAQTLLGDKEASFATDIRPWLGDEIGIALTGMPPLAMFMAVGAGQIPPVDLAALIEVADPAGAQAFLDKALKHLASITEDITLTDESSGGVAYTVVDNGGPTQVSIGIVENALVIGFSTRAIKDVIEVAAGETAALAAQRGFARIYSDMDPDSVLRIYTGPALYTGLINDPFLWQVVEQGIESGQFDLSGMGITIGDPDELREQALAVAATIDGLALGFSGRGNAMVMDIVAGFDLAALEEATGQPVERVETKINPDIFTLLPPDSGGVLAATNLAGLYEGITTGMQLASPQTSQELGKSMQQFESALGQKVEDVLAWLRGTFALAFVANPDFDPGKPNDLPVNLILVFEATDLEQVQATFDALQQVAERERVKAETTDIAGVTALTVTTREGMEIQFALVKDHFVLTTGAGTIEKVINAAQSGQSYAATPQWERVTGIANARGPFLATLEAGALVEISALQAQGIDEFGSANIAQMKALAEAVETFAIIAPGAEEGAPAHVTLFITLSD
ncbi:MAG: DUF3352 domain-containing protein [Anaerolineae bacterium]|nr:DUF3352 domain-containing protein [Anaerolineae bacterium]